MSDQKIMNEFSDLLRENTKLKQRIRELEYENGALEIAFDSCLKEADIGKIKADAVRSAAKLVFVMSAAMSSDCYDKLNKMADKLEKGEIE